MRVYLDASAAVKLVAPEKESQALIRHLDGLDPQTELVSSVLLETELRRFAVREGLEQRAVTNRMAQISLIILQRSDFVEAGLFPVIGLGSLDALHLVTAMRAEADVIVVYDRRLIEAARTIGMPVLSPV